MPAWSGGRWGQCRRSEGKGSGGAVLRLAGAGCGLVEEMVASESFAKSRRATAVLPYGVAYVVSPQLAAAAHGPQLITAARHTPLPPAEALPPPSFPRSVPFVPSRHLFDQEKLF